MAGTVSELMAAKISSAQVNQQTWDIFYNAKENGLKGDGTTDDYAKLNTLINTTINGAKATILFDDGTYIIGTNITIPSNVCLYFINGAMLSPSSGKTITINGPIEAGIWQIFTGSGTIAGSMEADRIYPQWWGAVGDGVANDTAAIQAAVNYVVSVGRKEIYLPTGTYLYTTLTSTTDIVFIGDGVTLNGTTSLTLISFAVLNEVKNAIPSPLRIAMHYYYENNPTKLALLKSLGFNCILISRGVSFLTDSTRTIAFLDRLYDNGVSVIFYVDYTQLGSGTSYRSWFDAIKNHLAVIGFSHFDEPFDQAIPIATTELAYTTIKALTDKPIFVVDPGNSVTTYTPNCFDVFIMDIYLTNFSGGLENADPKVIKRTIYYLYLKLYKRTLGKKRPKKFIPMFPLFSKPSAWNAPTKNLIQTMIDTYALFDVTDYAVFGFNVKTLDSTFTAIEDSTTLQMFCNYLRTLLYTRNQEIVYIQPKNFKTHKNYVSSSNMLYSSANDIMYVDGAQPSGNVVVRINREECTSTELYASIQAKNQGGAATHTINISVSFDGTTYEQTKTFTLPPTTGQISPAASDTASVISFPIDQNSAYVKFELVYTGVPGDATAIGFGEMTCTII
jgi:hypothetical protein